MRIKIQMIPKSAYGKNVRSEVSASEWRRISLFVREQAAVCVGGDENGPCRIVYRCEICGEEYEKISDLDAHEEWTFQNGKQKLKNIRAVCVKCHRVIHLGRTIHAGFEKEAKRWFCQVNRCSKKEYRKARDKAFRKWNKRSGMRWKLDISNLERILESKKNSGCN